MRDNANGTGWIPLTRKKSGGWPAIPVLGNMGWVRIHPRFPQQQKEKA